VLYVYYPPFRPAATVTQIFVPFPASLSMVNWPFIDRPFPHAGANRIVLYSGLISKPAIINDAQRISPPVMQYLSLLVLRAGQYYTMIPIERNLI